MTHLRDFTTDKRVLFLSALAIAVGCAGTASAWVLLRAIALVTHYAHAPGLWIALVPVAGGLIVGLMARFGSEKIRGHGIPEALEAILFGNSRMSLRVAILKPLSAAISIGTGGPFGAEGPIIMSGGAVGSLFAQAIRLSPNETKTLLVAGACAGMTAVFGTPLAAIVLAVEFLLFEWRPASFVPVVAACLTAAVTRTPVIGTAPLFPHTGAMPLDASTMVLCGELGIICGVAATALTWLVYACEDGFAKLPVHWMWWPAIGGVAVGLGGLLDPAALGVGYNNIASLIAGHLALSAVLSLLVVKTLIWAVALGSGTSGGVLAPLLMIGGCAGALFGELAYGHPGDWALVGMAAVMGGTMRAPVTAALFAFEVTGDAGLLVPIFAACCVSYAFTVLVLPRSILTEKVARRGFHISRELTVIGPESDFSACQAD